MMQQSKAREEEQAAGAGESAHRMVGLEAGIPASGTPFRPLTRLEMRSLWTQQFGNQDFALQMWTRLVERQGMEIEMMLQVHGLLVFGVMTSTESYIQFYIDLNERLYRESDPETADMLRESYLALLLPPDQPEIGPDGLPILLHYVHMRDVMIMSAGHSVKVPFWRGRVSEVEAFVMGAAPTEQAC